MTLVKGNSSIFLILLLLAALVFGPLMVIGDRRDAETPAPSLRTAIEQDRLRDAPNASSTTPAGIPETARSLPLQPPSGLPGLPN